MSRLMANLCGPGDAQAMYGRLVAGSHETVQWDRNVTTIIFPEAAYLCLSADEAKEQNSRDTSFTPRYLPQLAFMWLRQNSNLEYI